ncbi:MAG TPA: autotransporter-associated beta strand repeat-containing protein [Candidatus Udaeobacter sp.]|nr:autotransporter-associated beta strand repeat-containing protein [Candidatus Udaeobacter sp.]
MRKLFTNKGGLLVTSRAETVKTDGYLRSFCLFTTAFVSIVTVPSLTAGSATWNLNPVNSDWNTAANWTPETVPDENTDTATFGVSNITNISVAFEFGLDSMVFNSGASPYTFAISEPYVGFIGFGGAGVINNSGVTQNFDCFGNVGFGGAASAGDAVVYTNRGGRPNSTWISFVGESNAGSATFINEGESTDFERGSLVFNDTSSADRSSIINEQGDLYGGDTTFYDSSTAANSTITAQPGAHVEFNDNTTAGSAILIADGGVIYFKNSATGQLARVELINGGVLDMIGPDSQVPMTIGSLEGDSTGEVHLGSRHLTVGGNGLSATFNGVVGGGGFLIKTGNEKLILAGANTYTGGTTVTGGTLLGQAASGSATGFGPVQVNAGTFGGTGTVKGPVTVGAGTGPRAFLAPGLNGPGNLSITRSLTFKSNSSYKCELALTPHPRADQVSANGVTIETGAQFVFRTKGNQTLPPGTSFTIINNTAATPISGVFANLADGSTIVAGSNTLQASYEGSDANDLTLTVLP